MRRELKKAADKLRLKLQNLEEQIIDNQNKHTMEKNNWESQRIQYISQNNKVCELLALIYFKQFFSWKSNYPNCRL